MGKHQTDECEEIQAECDFKSIGCDYNEVCFNHLYIVCYLSNNSCCKRGEKV